MDAIRTRLSQLAERDRATGALVASQKQESQRAVREGRERDALARAVEKEARRQHLQIRMGVRTAAVYLSFWLAGWLAVSLFVFVCLCRLSLSVCAVSVLCVLCLCCVCAVCMCVCVCVYVRECECECEGVCERVC